MSNELILAISGNDIFSGEVFTDLATYTTNKQHGFGGDLFDHDRAWF